MNVHMQVYLSDIQDARGDSDEERSSILGKNSTDEQHY